MNVVHQQALDAVRRWLRAGQDVHVTGDVGAGRSTVLRALAEALRTAGTPAVELPGTAGGESVPLGALLSHRTLRPRGSVARWGVPEAAAALGEALGGGSTRQGAVVVVDDAHLLDQPSLTVLGAVARQHPDRVRLVTAVPPGAPADDPWSELAGGSAAVPIAPLGVNAVSTLLTDVLGGPVEGALAAAVAGRTGGNPRAVVALVTAAAGAGAVVRERGRWVQASSFELVPTDAVLQGLIGRMPADLRSGLESLAWFGLLGIDHARTLLGDERLAALDAAGRVVVDQRTDAWVIAVSPPVLAQALRARLTGARRLLLREQAEELFGVEATDSADGGGALAGALTVPVEPEGDVSVSQQVAIVTESVRTRAALWTRAWTARHDVASALPLLRMHLVDGQATVDVDEIFAATARGSGDDPEQVAAYVALRAQWAALRGGSFREGLLHDPGPSGLLVADDVGEPFLRVLDQVYGDEPERAVDPGTFDAERDVAPTVREYATVQQIRATIEAGAPDRALDLLGGWQRSAPQNPYTHRLDALRGDALLMVGQLDDAVAWGRERVSAAYDELNPLGLRLAARGLATAFFLQGDEERAAWALGSALRLGRIGPLLSPFDERIFGLAAVLHARAGHRDLASTLLDELDATPRPFVPALDFLRPWARTEVEHALSGSEPDGEPLWAAGEERWELGRIASAVFCWALSPQRLSEVRLARLEEGFAAVHVPLLAPAVRLHRCLVHGTSAEVLAAARGLRVRGALADVATTTASSLAVAEGLPAPGVEDLVPARGSSRRASGRPVAGAPSGLTAREAEIVGLVRHGLANKEVASRLFLSVRTVESHLYRAMQKLGVSDRHQLVD